MKLKEYKELIDQLVKDGHGEKIVIFARDEEGNGYDDVHYHPTIMKVKDIYEYKGKGKGQVVCIN